MEPTAARLIPAASIFKTLCDLSRPADVRASSKVRLDRFPSPQHDIETEKSDIVAAPVPAGGISDPDLQILLNRLEALVAAGHRPDSWIQELAEAADRLRGNNEIHQDYLRERQLIGVAIQSCNQSSNG